METVSLKGIADSNNKPLAELSVEDIAYLVDQLEMPRQCVALVREKRIGGRLLGYVQCAEDLVKCGLRDEALSELHLAMLFDLVSEFKQGGVPLKYLRPVVVTAETETESHDSLPADTADTADTSYTADTAATAASVPLPPPAELLADTEPAATPCALPVLEEPSSPACVSDDAASSPPPLSASAPASEREAGIVQQQQAEQTPTSQTTPSAHTPPQISSAPEPKTTPERSPLSPHSGDTPPVDATTNAAVWELGMGVKIRAVSEEEAEEMQRAHGGLSADMLDMRSKTGRLVRIDTDGDLHVEIGGVLRCWNPSLVEVADKLTTKPPPYHSGEYRDQSKCIAYCAIDSNSGADSEFRCEHGGAIIRSNHWSCCGKTSSAAKGCVAVFSTSDLPPLSVGSTVRIKHVPEEEARSLQEGRGGLSEDMIAMIGCVGSVVSINGDGGFCVRIGEKKKWWSPVLVEDATDHVIAPLCGRERSHVMQQWRGVPPSYDPSAAVKCDVCDRSNLELDMLLFHCRECAFNLCTFCSASTVPKPVCVRNVSEDEMRRLMQGHGGNHKKIKKLIGKRGVLTGIDTGGDCVVSFDSEDTRQASDPVPNLAFNPLLLNIDTARLTPHRVGSWVRIRCVPKAELRLLQKDFGGYSTPRLRLMGRVGVVEKIATSGALIIRCGGTVLSWNPALVESTDGVSDLAVGMCVKIADEEVDILQRLQKFHGGFTTNMISCRSMLGIVESVKRNANVRTVCVRIGPTKYKWNALLVQILPDEDESESEDSEEDEVIIVRIRALPMAKAKAKQEEGGGIYVNGMTAHLGKTGKLKKVDNSGDMHVRIGKSVYAWNRELVEIISPTSEFQLDAHLAKLMGRIVPGRLVYIKRCGREELAKAQKGHGGVSAKMWECLGESGTVIGILPNGDMVVDVDGKRFIWNSELLEPLDEDFVKFMSRFSGPLTMLSCGVYGNTPTSP